MATELIRVSELPAKTTQFVDGDLGIVSEYNGGTYVSKSINLSKFFAVGAYNTGDINAAIQSGVYRLGSTNTNMPSTDGNFGQLIVNRGSSGDTVTQTVMSYSGNKMWIRGASGIPGSPVWSAWVQIPNFDNSMCQAATPTSGTILNYVHSTIVYKARFFYASGASVSGLPATTGAFICWFVPAGGNSAGVLHALDWSDVNSTIYHQTIVNNTASAWQKQLTSPNISVSDLPTMAYLVATNGSALTGTLGADLINTNFSLTVAASGTYMCNGYAYVDCTGAADAQQLGFVVNGIGRGVAGPMVVHPTVNTPMGAHVNAVMDLTAGEVVRLKLLRNGSSVPYFLAGPGSLSAHGLEIKQIR